MELPELLSCEPSEAPDVIIRRAPVGANPNDARRLGPYLYAKADQFWLTVPSITRFLVRDGREIIIEPAADADDDSVRVFLLGSAFGVLLFQRRYLVLHGNALQVNGQCLVCVGNSGAGKSTLAAALLQRGYPFLADDVVPVNSNCQAVPGFPRLKLWQDSATRLGIDTAELGRIRPGMEKFNLPVAQAMAAQPLPIRWVYILNSHKRDEFEIEPIHGMARFAPLHDNTYRVRYLEGMALKAEHLQLCGQLSSRIRLVRITRPDRGFSIDALADRILADAAAHS